MNQQKSLLIGALLGALAVALGAFGAHAIKPMLISSGRVETYELATRYEFYHALALFLVGILQQSQNSKYIKASALLFLSGTILFSGSLYLLCFTNNIAFARVTPVGGLLLVLGWVVLALGIISNKK